MRATKSCLFVVGGDVLIEWYQHGTYIENYDYIDTALNVLECTGNTAKATDFAIFTVDLKELPTSFYKISKNALVLTSKFYVL
jgi:hypothetical protein